MEDKISDMPDDEQEIAIPGDENQEEFLKDDDVVEKKEKEKKKKRNNKKKQGQWRKAKENTWIYIQNLPEDVTISELNDVFKRYGIIQQSIDGSPRIKLYRDENGKPKGDASICYLRKESIPMAITMQDDSPLRYTDSMKIHVSEAVFEKKEKKVVETEEEDEKDKKLRWLHLQQQKQSLSWAEDETDIPSVGLRIIVLQNMFTLEESGQPGFKDDMIKEVHVGCDSCGIIEKVTVFDKNPEGIIIIKFKTAVAAENGVKLMNGRMFAGRKIKSFFWDGHTDYRSKISEEEEMKKLNSFADWIENNDD